MGKKICSLVLLVLTIIVFGENRFLEEDELTPPKIDFKLEWNKDFYFIGEKGELKLNVSIPKGYHIYAGESFNVSLESQSLKLIKVEYPKPLVEDEFPIYRGDFSVKIVFEVIDGKGTEGILKISYQACQDFGKKVCFMPQDFKIPLAIDIKKGMGQKEQIREEEVELEKGGNETLFVNLKEKGRFVGYKSGRDFKEWFESLNKGQKTEKNLFSEYAQKNVLIATIIAFFFGILSSLTPCVYPVIPITIAYIGSRVEKRNRWSGFILSLFFVLGLSLVYSILGLISSLVGVSFGTIAQKPIVGISIAIIFTLLGFSMFNMFEISMPNRFATKIEEKKRKGRGYFGAFFIGALSGLVASPCIGPLLLAILVIIANLKSPFLGFIYMFSFALGMGVLFILIGTFSSIISSLPKSGSWMDFIRVIFGSLIIGASFYFFSIYLGKTMFFVVSLIVILIVSLFLLLGFKKHYFHKLVQFSGILFVVLSFLIIWQLNLKGGEVILFEKDIKMALERAQREKKPVLIDFRADWCVACVELEKKTWVSKEGKEILNRVIPLQIDLTKIDKEKELIMKNLKVSGLPTVILFDYEEDKK